MRTMARRVAALLMATAAMALAACTGTQFEPPDVQGAPLMVAVDGKPLLLVLTKQEERRVLRIGGGSRSSSTEPRDTLFHFDLRAYAPVSQPCRVGPCWPRRLTSTIATRLSRPVWPACSAASQIEPSASSLSPQSTQTR